LTEQYSLFCQIGVESRKRRYSAESTEVISHDAGADEPLLWKYKEMRRAFYPLVLHY